MAPAGITPVASPLPPQMMSGVTPYVWAANMSPVLPKPVSTSSKIRRTSCRVQMSRIISKYSAVGVTMPPVLQTGSRITPAIVSAPSLMMTSS